MLVIEIKQLKDKLKIILEPMTVSLAAVDASPSELTATTLT